jgi:hypothetical protein
MAVTGGAAVEDEEDCADDDDEEDEEDEEDEDCPPDLNADTSWVRDEATILQMSYYIVIE